MDAQQKENFILAAHLVDVVYQKDELMFYKKIGYKKDRVTEFICKYVYVRDCKKEVVTVGMLANLLSETENTIRIKIKDAIKYNLLVKIKSPKDKRVTIVKPTPVLKRLMEIQAVRLAKTIIQFSDIANALFKDWVKDLAKEYDLEGVPSFKDNTNEFHRTFAKQFQLYIENGKKLKSKRRNLG
jgi:DNA-binding MarR family transcriptional regulator